MEELHDLAASLDDLDAFFAKARVPEGDLLLEVLDFEAATQQCVATGSNSVETEKRLNVFVIELSDEDVEVAASDVCGAQC